MKKPLLKTCFISAPFGVDTSVIRRALEANGVRWLDQTSLDVGTNWLDKIDSTLEGADFVCAVLPESRYANVLFEIGVAYGRRKPVLLFVGPSALVPSDLTSLTYVKADPTDSNVIEKALVTFLRHAKKPRPSSARPKSAAIPTQTQQPLVSGREFEQRTALLLQDAGFIVSAGESKDRGIDLAVWSDELQNSLGNPLLVEVQAGILSPERIVTAATKLRHYTQKTNGRCALLVYWDTRDRQYAGVSQGWPLVIQISGNELTRLVQEKRLISELIHRRNAAVHGEV